MHKGPFILGIDIGGTGVKTGLLTLEGKITRRSYQEYRMVSNLPGQAEHDAVCWWDSTISAIRRTIEGLSPDEISSVGVSCTNGLIPVDGNGEPLGPAIMLWDQRALPEVRRISEALDPDEVFRITGNPVAPGAYSLPTLLWLKNDRPDIFNRAHKLMVPGGYIVARLTGEFSIDHSRACTTLLFDIKRLRWHNPFLEALEIPSEKLPRPMSSTEIAGEVTAEAAAMTGLAKGTPVIAGCMDTISASAGSGSTRPGECFIIMGTAARVASILGTPNFDVRFMNSTHIEDGTWLSIGAINGVGSSLRWIRDSFGHMEQSVGEIAGRSPYDLLTSQAANSPPGSKGLIFLPYIAGERTPIWNPYARGVFFGVTLGHGRGEIFRSVLEGAAFAMRQVIEILEREVELAINELRIGGAASESDIWMQIICDVIGKEVVTLSNSDTEVLGAALLAGIGTGSLSEDILQSGKVATIGKTFEPNAEAHNAYNNLFPIYKELYPDLEPYFQRLAELDLPQVWIRKEK